MTADENDYQTSWVIWQLFEGAVTLKEVRGNMSAMAIFGQLTRRMTSRVS
jgi:hypothetical protein